MAKNYIEVEVEDREVINGTIYADTEVFWAVRPSPDRTRSWKEGEPEPDYKELKYPWSGGFILQGGQSVYVYDKSDVEALRKLLDAIEEELGNE